MAKIENVKVFAFGEIPGNIVKSQAIITEQFENYIKINNNNHPKYYTKGLFKNEDKFTKCINFYEKHEKSNLEEMAKTLDNIDTAIVLANLKDKDTYSNIEVISKAARQKGVLVIAMVLIPHSTVKNEQLQYDREVKHLAIEVDTLIPLLAEKIAFDSKFPLVSEDGIDFSDSYMLFCLEQLTQFFIADGLVKLDMEDINAIFKDGGLASILLCNGHGEDKIETAIRQVLSNKRKIDKCNKLLIGVSGSKDMSLTCVNEILERVQAIASEDCNIIFSAFTDDELKDELIITILCMAISGGCC